MLNLDSQRTPAVPRLASTVILLKDSADGPLVCMMQRSNQSSFLGGAVVFPGGRVEDTDQVCHWEGLVEESSANTELSLQRRIAACRETFEEVGLALITPDPDRTLLQHLRDALPTRLSEVMRRHSCQWNVARLIPWSRWVTPEAENRRYDAYFFVCEAPSQQELFADGHEATRVLWSTPSALLEAFLRDEIALFPPTHRTLEELVSFSSVREILLHASSRAFAEEPICPRFFMDDDVPTLALPGDMAHSIQEKRSQGRTRYVLSEGKWLPK